MGIITGKSYQAGALRTQHYFDVASRLDSRGVRGEVARAGRRNE
jgi:hypothetical protein